MDKEIFNIIQDNNNEYALYVYGDIISGSNKWDESDVTLDDFKKATDEIKPNTTLNIYVSSGGGSVFTTQAMMSILDRTKKEKKCHIKAHLDGLAASCASFLPMVADEIIVYENTIMMLHKPMSGAWGNANELQKTINLLDKLENDIMLPAYMSKAKEGITEDKIRDMLAAETWLNAEEINDIFNVTYIKEEKQAAANIDYSIINKYRNVPQDLKKSFFNAQNKVKKPVMDQDVKEMVARIKEKAKEWA